MIRLWQKYKRSRKVWNMLLFEDYHLLGQLHITLLFVYNIMLHIFFYSLLIWLSIPPQYGSFPTQKRKFVIVSSISKKKHTFLMEKSRIARYLCSLCTAQHKFHMELSSRQMSHSLVSGKSHTVIQVLQ